MTQRQHSTEKDGRIPTFASREEEAAWWDRHDLADYQHDFRTVEATFAEDLSGEDATREQRPIA